MRLDRLGFAGPQNQRGSDGPETGGAVDDGLEVFGTGGVDVEQEAVLAGESVDVDHLGKLCEVLEADGDAGMGGKQPDPMAWMLRPSRVVDHRPVAGDDAGLFHALDARRDGRL
jgi:hypothetical protein